MGVGEEAWRCERMMCVDGLWGRSPVARVDHPEGKNDLEAALGRLRISLRARGRGGAGAAAKTGIAGAGKARAVGARSRRR